MAPRSIWKGSITFGLITIPVKIFTAVGRTNDDKIDLHLLHAKDGARIHYDRVCAKGHKDIDWDDIVKGYEVSKGKWVEITDEDLEAIELESLRTIDVVSFVPFEQIDPIFFDKTYYVVPEESAVKAYQLMLGALEEQDLVGIAKVAIRDKEHLSALRVADKMLYLETMHWPEEIRDTRFAELGKRVRIQPRERQMAGQLIRQLTDDFDPGRFKDEYHKALKKLIRKKVKGEEIVVREEPETTDGPIDLMEALKASVEAARRGEKPRRRASSNGSGGDGDLAAMTKRELIEQAKKLDIEGRSTMDKQELVKAIRKSA